MATTLSIGQPAPAFTATTVTGETINLRDLRGRKVWLAFFRYVGCPLCNLRIHELIRRHGDLEEKGLALLAVFQSPVERLRRFADRRRPPFTLISDPDEALYRLYGVTAGLAGFLAPSVIPKLAKAAIHGFWPGATDGTKTRLPADFLIDEGGVIADLFQGRDIGEHIPIERVEKFLHVYGSGAT
jgi:peroxiredoxin